MKSTRQQAKTRTVVRIEDSHNTFGPHGQCFGASLGNATVHGRAAEIGLEVYVENTPEVLVCGVCFNKGLRHGLTHGGAGVEDQVLALYALLFQPQPDFSVVGSVSWDPLCRRTLHLARYDAAWVVVRDLRRVFVHDIERASGRIDWLSGCGVFWSVVGVG